MAIATEFSIDYVAKTVMHTGASTTVYTVLEFFQYLAEEFAATAQMDDDYPFVSDTPQVYRWTNDWDMANTTSYQYLKGGAITTSDYVALTSGSVFSNLYSIGDQYRNSKIYVIQGGVEISPWWQVTGGNIDILIQIISNGTANDSGLVTVMSRDSDSLYDHSIVDLSAGGRNPVGINTAQDLNYLTTGDSYIEVDSSTDFNLGAYIYGITSASTGRIQYVDTANNRIYLCQIEGTLEAGEPIKEATTRLISSTTGTVAVNSTLASVAVISSYTDISVAFGEISRDLNNGDGFNTYNVAVNCNGRAVLPVYQYLKYICNHNSSITVNSVDGEQYISSSGGYTAVKQAPLGTFAGGTFFGAKGVWLISYASAAFQLVDCGGDQQLPPSYQKVTVSHASLTSCNILVAETSSGSVIFKTQYVVSVTGSNFLVVSTTINSNKVTQSGTLRMGDTKFSFASFDASGTFSSVTPSPTGTSISGSGGSLYVPLLDVTADAATEQSDNIIYTQNIDVRARVRKYGFKDFTLDTQFGSAGLTVTPVLADDPQAT